MGPDLTQQTLTLAQSLAREGRYAQALEHLLPLGLAVKQGLLKLPPALQHALAFESWRCSPLWWEPITAGRLTLRRAGPEDSDFYRGCFEDAAFSARFHRGRAWRGDLKRALANAERSSPVDSRTLQWIALNHGAPIGLVGLSNLDATHRRAEFSIGFPRPAPHGTALGAYLLAMRFTLLRAGLHKVYAHVYEDNAQVAGLLARVGWLQEGRLVDHYRLGGRYVSVDSWALTAERLTNSPVWARSGLRK